MDERKASRVEQLREGMLGAAAALPEAHADLGSRAARAADRVASRVEALDAAGRIDEAVERMERLHYGLLRMAVLEEAPPETEVEETLAELDRVAGAAEPGAAEPGAAEPDAAAAGGSPSGGSESDASEPGETPGADG